MKILVLSSHTPSLFWFRLDMMKSFMDKGHEVIAVAQESEAIWSERFNEHGIQYRQVSVQRNGMNPISDLRTLKELYSLINEQKPDRIFIYQAKTIIYGATAAYLNSIHEVYSLVAGLGSVFRGSGFKNRILSIIMGAQYKWAFNKSRKVIFQNADDARLLLSKNLLKRHKVEMINGSGVNIERFQPVPLPVAPAFLYIGRLIRDKGVMEYLEACRILKSTHGDVRCLLVGPFDTNPSALSPEDLKPYISSGIIEYFGEQKDVRPYVAQCSTYVLPSYHEGTPKTVLEAMAMGRSIITSDAPGCRETVMDGVNGFLVEVKNVDMIVEKMKYLIEHPDVNQQMALESVKMARDKYDVRKVNDTIIRIMGL